MQRLAVGGAESIDCREWRDLDANCVNHQRVALVVADRVALPARRQAVGMSPIQANMTHCILKQVNERDLVAPLQDHHSKMKRHHIWRRLGPAGIVQVLRYRAVEDELAELLDGFSCLGLEIRIRM